MISINFAGARPITITKRTCDVATSARKEKRQQVGGGGFGGGGGGGKPRESGDAPSGTATPSSVSSDLNPYRYPSTTPSTISTKERPSPGAAEVGRERIIATCIQSSVIIAVVGLGLHQLTPIVSIAAHDVDADALARLLAWPTVPTVEQLGVAAATAAGITAARLALLAVWPDFKASTDASNKQVLLPLRGLPLDVAVVACLPAITEELLFRGALLPAIAPDWRGVVISGAVFGALHINGGRNAAFGAWAAAVGCAYGAAFVATGNVLVPMAAHAAGNVASAAVWLQQRETQQGS